MDYRLTAEMPFAARNAKYGWESSDRYNQNRKLALSLLQGRTRLIKDMNRFEASGKEGTTIVHYRDTLIAWALGQTLINTQYTNASQTKLTTTASKVWEYYSYDDLWPYQSLKEPRKSYHYAGLFGEPAYWFIKQSQTNYSLVMLEKLCSTFWFYQGLSTEDLPRTRIMNLVDKLNAPVETIKQAEYHWKNLFDNPPTDPEEDRWELLIAARRSFLGVSAANNLKHKLLFGEYTDTLLNTLISFITVDKFQERLVAYQKNCISLAKPSGILLVLQFLIIESLVSSARFLTNLGADRLANDITSLSPEEDYELACRFALLYDATKLLTPYLKCFDSLQAYSLLLYWLSASGSTTIAEDNDYRIEGLV